MDDSIQRVNMQSGVAERYYARLIQGLTDDQAREFIATNGGKISMPCGTTVIVKDASDQRCPNSGNCSAGIKECWVVKRV